jgi:hypothetical protein
MNVGKPSAESLVRARVWMSDYEDADWDENDLARLLDTIREEERERVEALEAQLQKANATIDQLAQLCGRS